MTRSTLDTLGIVEARSIAGGVELADLMMKAAEVELIKASTICSGRYLIFVAGARAAVSAAVQVAQESGRKLSGSFVISNISPQVMTALRTGCPPQEGDAIGIVECRTVSSGVMAADSAVKRSEVKLCRLVAGQGINGKSYFVLGGNVAAVREAAQTAETVLGSNLIEKVVIARPDASVARSLIRGVSNP